MSVTMVLYNISLRNHRSSCIVPQEELLLPVSVLPYRFFSIYLCTHTPIYTYKSINRIFLPPNISGIILSSKIMIFFG